MTWNNVYQQLNAEEIIAKFPYVEPDTGRKFQHVALEQSSNSSSAGEVRIIQGRQVVSEIGWRWSQKTFDKRLGANPNLIYWTQSGRPRYKIYLNEYKGKPVGNIWTSDIPYLATGSKEKTSYPTQKSLALLKRLIKAYSNENELVLDPFCGCATACIASEELNRNWIGIDISEKAIDLVKLRFENDLAILNLEIIHRTDFPIRSDGVVRSKGIKHVLYGQQEGYCQGCNRHFEYRNLEIDHIVPKSKGDPDDDSNLQLLCGNCNKMKGDKTMAQLKPKLKRIGII